MGPATMAYVHGQLMRNQPPSPLRTTRDGRYRIQVNERGVFNIMRQTDHDVQIDVMVEGHFICQIDVVRQKAEIQPWYVITNELKQHFSRRPASRKENARFEVNLLDGIAFRRMDFRIGKKGSWATIIAADRQLGLVTLSGNYVCEVLQAAAVTIAAITRSAPNRPNEFGLIERPRNDGTEDGGRSSEEEVVEGARSRMLQVTQRQRTPEVTAGPITGIAHDIISRSWAEIRPSIEYQTESEESEVSEEEAPPTDNQISVLELFGLNRDDENRANRIAGRIAQRQTSEGRSVQRRITQVRRSASVQSQTPAGPSTSAAAAATTPPPVAGNSSSAQNAPAITIAPELVAQLAQLVIGHIERGLPTPNN